MRDKIAEKPINTCFLFPYFLTFQVGLLYLDGLIVRMNAKYSDNGTKIAVYDRL